MARGKTEVGPAPVEVSVTQPDVQEEQIPRLAVESDEPFVTREEHDNAVRALRDEISSLKETVADLETIVTQPQGAVRFGPPEEVQGPGNHTPEQPREVPWYNPGL